MSIVSYRSHNLAPTREVVPSARTARAAKVMGQISALAYNVSREKANTGLTGEQKYGKETEAVMFALRSTKMAKHVLATLLPDHDKLIGAGLQSLVFGDEKGRVVKKGFRNLDNTPEELEEEIAVRQARYGEVRDKLGHIAQTTTYGLDTVRFRPIDHDWRTIAITQPRLDDRIDVFSKRGAEIIANSHGTQLHEELEHFITATNELRTGDTWVDIAYPGNLVIAPDEDTAWALRLVDTEPFSNHNLDRYIPSRGRTEREELLRRSSQLESMVRGKSV